MKLAKIMLAGGGPYEFELDVDVTLLKEPQNGRKLANIDLAYLMYFCLGSSTDYLFCNDYAIQY